MTTVEKISQQSRNLPEIYQAEVLDFVEYLVNKSQFFPQGAPTDFWQSPSLEELAVSQGVEPMSDLNIIAGTWPGTDEDRFEEDILAMRALRKAHEKETGR